MKFSEIPQGSIFRFPFSQFVWRNSSGNETIISNKTIYGISPKIVSQMPDYVPQFFTINAGPEQYGRDSFGSASSAMKNFRFRLGTSQPFEDLFPFYSSSKIVQSADYEHISETTYFRAESKINFTNLVLQYGFGNDESGEYRIYLNSRDKSWWLKLIISESQYSYSIVPKAYRNDEFLFDFPVIYTGTSNPLHFTNGGTENWRYIWSFSLTMLTFPYYYNGLYRKSFGTDTHFSLGFTSFIHTLNIGKEPYKSLSQAQWFCNMVTENTASVTSSSINPTIFDSWIEEYDEIDVSLDDSEDGENPYIDGGSSDVGGGDGNFSENSDDPTTDDLPEIGAIGTGFATIFKPSLSQLRTLSQLFWNSNVFTFLQNLVENITDMFTSLAMVPFEVTAGNTVSVTWLGIDTAISLTLAAKQYYEFDMGSINLAHDDRIFTSGSALDYSPFSTLGIYLPFIGYQELDIDECRGAVINLRYRIDILSGACVAIIRVAGRDIYQFTGNCLTQIPITNENMQSLVTDAVNVGIAMAGAQAAKGTMSAVEDSIASNGMSADKSELAMAHANASLGHSESRLASATANVITSGKPSFKKSGAISSSASMFAVKQPYLFLTTPRQSIPEKYQKYCGFPSNISGVLGSFPGYTVVEDIRLNDLVATSPEVAEIYKLLKQGVIV